MAKGAGKGKKGKSKKQEEQEAARLAATEESRRLENERLKLEEDERIRDEAARAERQQVEGARLAEETARLHEERESQAPFIGTRESELRRAHSDVDSEVEWERFISCVPLPDPRFECEINGYLITVQDRMLKDLQVCLKVCADNELIVKESVLTVMASTHFGNEVMKAKQQEYEAMIRGLTAGQLDRVTAHILQHADEFQNAKGEVQVQAQDEGFKFGLWVNLAKNPRFKTISIPELGFISELPKPLALASIAVRMLHVHYDQFTAKAQNEYMTVGGVFTVDLLGLPPLPKKVKGWTLRMVTALATAVMKSPYPIPPAGGEVSAATSATAPPPMGITYPLPDHVVVLEAEPEVGWWDARQEMWRTDGITDVKYNPEKHSMSFWTTKLTSLGLLLSRIKLLPYKEWHVRPTSPTTGVLSLKPEHSPLNQPISFHIGERGCRLLSPDLPALKEHMVDEIPPALLLKRLSRSGLHLLPENRDAEFTGIDPKVTDLEKMLCKDLALLSTTFLIGSSKWNRDTGEDDCIFRLAELLDYTRTEDRDVVKVFEKEKENVMTILRKEKGCAFLPIRNVDSEMSDDMRTQITPWDSISWEQEGVKPLRFSACLNVLLKDKATPDTLDRIETASAAFTESVNHLMYTLRLFSFG